MQQPASPHWVQTLKNLAESLQEGEQQINLLRAIDLEARQIIEGKTTFEALIDTTLRQIVTLVRARSGYFLIEYGDTTVLVNSSGEGILDRDFIGTLKQRADQNNGFSYTEIENDGSWAILLRSFALLEPKLRAHLVLESYLPAALNRFTDLDTRNIIDAVVLQIGNVFRFTDEWRRRGLQSQILTEFLESDLKPTLCLQILTRQIPTFLPWLGSFRVDPDPQVQVLFYREGDNFLTIRGTTGEERDITRVKVDESICGYLVTHRDWSHYVCDPLDETGRYKRYLGRDKGSIMRSELAVPVHDNGELVAILNLESPNPVAFKTYHIDTAIETSKILGPWIGAIRNRLDREWLREEALSGVMDNYVEGFSRFLRHNAGNAATGLAMRLENLEDRWKTQQPELAIELQMARRTAERFGTLLDEFVEETREAARLKPLSVNELINDSVRLLRDLQQRELQHSGTSIDFEPVDDFSVYCSKIFRQHFYNVLANSVYWINRRHSLDPSLSGSITIATRQVAPADQEQEVEFNRRCEIIVRDNGVGVDPAFLSKIRQGDPGLTARGEDGGTGFGLWALRQYVTSLGGWIDVDSEYGQWFEVRVQLDIFDPRIHQRIRGS